MEIRRTEKFDRWLSGLSDRKAKSRILVHIDRLRLGMIGNVKPVGSGISEVKIDYGPGYRIYYTWIENKIILLLAGGDKDSQNRDIHSAREMLKRLEK